MLLPLRRAMALALDDPLDWGEADDEPHAALPHSESAHEQSAPPDKLYVKRVEMPNTQEEEESDDTEQEADVPIKNTSASSFDPPSPRTQTDLSDAVPRLVFMDHSSEELYWPIFDSPDLAYKLYPIKLRPLPGAEDSLLDLSKIIGSGLLTSVPMTIPRRFPDYPDSHSTSLVDYDVLAQ